MVPHTKMPVTHQTLGGEGPTGHPSMESTAMVPSPSGNAGGIPQDSTRRPDQTLNPTGQEFIMTQVPDLVA